MEFGIERLGVSLGPLKIHGKHFDGKKLMEN